MTQENLKGGEIYIMGIIAWLILGAAAGWLASIVMKTDADQGALTNIVVGIVGAVLGGFIFSLFGQSGVSGFDLYSLIVAFIGAIVTIWLYKSFARRSR